MARIVNVHHVDYPSFEKGDAEYGDPEELVLVFGTSPSLVDVVEEVRRKLKWMDESDVVELVGRYNVGFGHIRWKTMSLNSELCRQAYKESVLASEVKSLELFAGKKVGAHLHIDLKHTTRYTSWLLLHDGAVVRVVGVPMAVVHHRVRVPLRRIEVILRKRGRFWDSVFI